jgi:hypothetical protein
MVLPGPPGGRVRRRRPCLQKRPSRAFARGGRFCVCVPGASVRECESARVRGSGPSRAESASCTRAGRVLHAQARHRVAESRSAVGSCVSHPHEVRRGPRPRNLCAGGLGRRLHPNLLRVFPWRHPGAPFWAGGEKPGPASGRSSHPVILKEAQRATLRRPRLWRRLKNPAPHSPANAGLHAAPRPQSPRTAGSGVPDRGSPEESERDSSVAHGSARRRERRTLPQNDRAWWERRRRSGPGFSTSPRNDMGREPWRRPPGGARGRTGAGRRRRICFRVRTGVEGVLGASASCLR